MAMTKTKTSNVKLLLVVEEGWKQGCRPMSLSRPAIGVTVSPYARASASEIASG
jgi:hypothetical protein